MGDNEDTKQGQYKFPAVIAIIFLLGSLLDWPYGYYMLLRVVVTAASLYYAYYIYFIQKKQNVWFWLTVGIAILFNPIIPVYLYSKAVWNVIDVVVAGVFGKFLIKGV